MLKTKAAADHVESHRSSDEREISITDWDEVTVEDSKKSECVDRSPCYSGGQNLLCK